MSEILHLQYGNLSNFIMTHYWNIQDELIKYRHDDFLHKRLYMELSTGLYIPRTLIFDMKDMYGYYAPVDLVKEAIANDPNVQVYEAEHPEKSPFTKYLDGVIEDSKEDELEMDEEELEQYKKEMNKEEIKGEVVNIIKSAEDKKLQEYEKQLNDLKKLYKKFMFDKHTQYWIDFAQTSYNSSNRVPVSLYEDIDDMADYQNGLVFAQENFTFRDEYEDAFRLMLEKADLISGLVLTFEHDNSFAGIAAETLSNYKQEIPKCPIVAFSPLNPFVKSNNHKGEPWQYLNILMATKDLIMPSIDVVVPFDFPKLKAPNAKLLQGVNMESKYHLSSLPVCAIDSLVHQFCRKSCLNGGMKEWINYFAYNSLTKIAHLRQSLPFLWYNKEKLVDAIKKIKMQDLDYLSPLVSEAKDIPYFSFNFLRASEEVKIGQVSEAFSSIQGVSTYMKNSFFDENILLPISHPRLFAPTITAIGQSIVIPQKDPLFVTQIPYYANIFLTYKTGEELKRMYEEVSERQMWIKKMMSKGKLIIDDWEELKTEIINITESYTSLKQS